MRLRYSSHKTFMGNKEKTGDLVQGTLDMLGLGRLNINITDLSSERLLSSVEEIISHRQQVQEEIRHSLNWACARIDDQMGTLLESTKKGL